MNRFAWYGACGLLLTVQAVTGLLPQVPWSCLTCHQRCPCLPAANACCGDCQNTVPVTPIHCGCNRDRLPTALVSVAPWATAMPDQAATVAYCPGVQPIAAAARWQSIETRRGDVPDLPARILFCTWLE